MMPFKKLTCLVAQDGKGRRKAPVEEDELQVVPVQVPEILEEDKGTCVIHLQKKDGVGLGVTVTGGCDKSTGPKVSNLRSTGIAARSDVLLVGDFITAVNGIRTIKMRHAEIISLLKNIGEKVTLEIEYRLPPTNVKTSTILQKSVEVKLHKEDNTFGFVVRGGCNENRQKSRPVVITNIRPASPAAKDGTMNSGDRILLINGNEASNMTLEQVNEELRTSDTEAIFLLEYDVSIMEAVSNASGPLLIEVSKTPGADLGLALAVSTHRKKSVICIEKVKPASVADRCGALHVGDQVLSIDGMILDTTTVTCEEATKMLFSTSDQIKLEILPVSHLAIEAPKATSPNRYAPTISSAQSLSALNSFPRRQHGGTLSMASTFRGGARSNRWKKNYNRSNKYSASAMSLTSMDYLSGNQVVHTEQLEVNLLSADDNCSHGSPSAQMFGIQLQGGIFATEVLTSPPSIAYVEPDSAADKSGVVQAGDRVLSINGCMCEDSTLDELNHMISDAMNAGQVLLETEFDITESVVPSSGTFHVKVPKKRGIDLGIIISSSGRVQAGESPLYISHVERGTVAHRIGTIQEGDRLIAIDGVRLDRVGGSVENAVALLENAEDVVKLKIKKEEDNSDEEGGSISYTVELKRYGDPLGITVSGTEEPFDPIIISGLSQGGLAARTGAIHEGDQILSINNVSLRAKPLTEAIRLLRSAGETVTLKIKKPAPVTPDPVSARWKHQRVHSATMPRHHVMREAISELSDPDDDVLPPPMDPVPPKMYGGRHNFSPVTPMFKGSSEDAPPQGMAGTHSVDSAMGSWDGEAHKASDLSDSNTHSHSLSPSTSPEVKQPQIKTPTNQTTRKRRENSARSIEALRANIQHQHSDWQNALDDLQSVGQSADIVRDLEESIMSTDNMTLNDDVAVNYGNNMFVTPPSRSHSVGRRNFGPSRSEEMKMFGSYGESLHTAAPLSLPTHRQHNNIQLHKLTLVKEDDEEFGFSLSDGQLERGVFVHTTKPHGAADRAGIRPYDRLLQINNTRTRDFDCCQAVPLISSCGSRIEVVIARNPANSSVMLPRHQPPLLSPPVNIPTDNDSLHAL